MEQQHSRIRRRMESNGNDDEPLIGLRKKTQLYRTFFLEALRHEDKAERREEQVSLESAFSRFMRAPDVLAYFSLVPFIADLMERIKPRCLGNELSEFFDTLARHTSSSGAIMANREAFKRAKKEINLQLDELEDQLASLIDMELNRQELEIDHEVVHNVLRHYWSTQRHAYLTQNTGLSRLTQSYVLHTLLGFNMGDKPDVYDQRWLDVVWNYLSERDHYNMLIIAALENTQRELDALYLTMKNVVTFKSLVILTIWRLQHAANDNNKKIIQLLRTSGDDDDSESDHEWTLAYGTFFKDYQFFIHWHQKQFEGRTVQINVIYIDFESSAASAALPVDMVNHNDHSNTSFAGIFIHHNEPLPLSYMKPQDDLMRLSPPSIKIEEKKKGFRSLFGAGVM